MPAKHPGFEVGLQYGGRSTAGICSFGPMQLAVLLQSLVLLIETCSNTCCLTDNVDVCLQCFNLTAYMPAMLLQLKSRVNCNNAAL